MNARPIVLTSKEFFDREVRERVEAAIGYKPGSVEEKSDQSEVFRLIHDGAPDEVEYRRERIKAAGDNPDKPKLLLPYTISTEARDRDGDRIMVRGWRLKLYRETNPIVLFNHNASQLPIGRSARVWREIREGQPSKLRAVAQFMNKEIDGGFAETIFRMAKGGFLPASSVGFIPRKYEKDPLLDEMSDEERKQIPYYGGWQHKETELLEWSPVMIPSNPYALNEARSAGIDVAPYVVEAEKALAGEESKLSGWVRDEVRKLFVAERDSEEEGRAPASLSTRGLFEQSIMETKTSKTFVQAEARNPYEGVEQPDADGEARDPVNEGKSAYELAMELAETAQETLKALDVAAKSVLEREERALADLEKAAEIINSILASARGEPPADPETPAGPVEERSATAEPDPRTKALNFLGQLLSTGS